ncbi:MAG: hypothetical protein V3V81_05875 [Candidatus Bathyarchaeia archaeon]
MVQSEDGSPMRGSYWLIHTRGKYLEGEFITSGFHSKKPTTTFLV